MKYLQLFILSIVIAFSCFAQSKNNSDSLQKIIASSVAYKEKIKAYIELTYQLNFKDPLLAITTANNGIQLAIANKDSLSIGKLMQYKGSAYNLNGNRDTAAVFYYIAAGIFERFKSDANLADVYNDIARMNRKTKDLDRALFYYDKAMDIYKRLNDEGGMATIYNESGVVFEYKGDYEEAIKRYKASLAIRQKTKDKIGEGYALSFLGGVYFMKKDYALSEKYCLEALAIRKQLNDSFAMALTYTDLGSLYKEMKNFPKAIESFKLSVVIGRTIKYLDLLAENYLQLSTIYNEQGDFKLAFENIQLHNQFKDSLYSIEKTKQIQELSTKYETEKNKSQIQQQQFEITKRNYWIAGVSGLMLLIALLSYSFYRRYQLKQQQRLQQAVLKQQDLATKAILEAEENERKRIASDLHDGVGQLMSAAKMNLSAMEAEIPFANNEQRIVYEKAVNLIDESCKEVRSVSHNMMPNALLKSGLANAVREFINQIDIRVIKTDLYTEGLNERIDGNIETVLYRVIQECVNNVIKHSGANHLDISLIKDKDGIAATIEDNGKGFDGTDKSKFEGIGLKNIQSRISYLKGTVEWNSSPGNGTLVAIHVPFS